MVPGLAGVVAVAAGADHSVALRADGLVNIWNSKPEVTPVIGLARITAIAAGGDRTVALRDDGTVWQREISILSIKGLEQVPGLSDIVAIAAGGRAAAQYDASRNFHGIALKRDGSVWNWGVSIFGQLGENAEPENYYHDIPAPVQVPPLRDVVALGAGNTFSYAVGRDGQVAGWGSNRNKPLGATSNAPCFPNDPPKVVYGRRLPLRV